MTYWVFHDVQLDQALAAFEARRQGDGATEQQAKDESAVIKLFLFSAEAGRAKLIGGTG